jgi:hypothetical protein
MFAFKEEKAYLDKQKVFTNKADKFQSNNEEFWEFGKKYKTGDLVLDSHSPLQANSISADNNLTETSVRTTVQQVHME